MAIVFYPKSHRYKIDGEWAPGVTSIIGKTKPKQLTGWAAGLVGEHIYNLWDTDSLVPLMQEGRDAYIAWARALPNQRRDQAGERGTSIHDAAEKLAAGEDVDIPPHLNGAVTAAARFMDEMDWQPTLSESVVANRTLWYCGKIDGLGTAQGVPSLIDWKSGGRIYDDVAYQMEAYARCEVYLDGHGNENPMPVVERHLAVHLTDDGYSVHPLESSDDLWEQFKAMRRLYDGYKRWKDYVGEAIAEGVVA